MEENFSFHSEAWWKSGVLHAAMVGALETLVESCHTAPDREAGDVVKMGLRNKRIPG